MRGVAKKWRVLARLVAAYLCSIVFGCTSATVVSPTPLSAESQKPILLGFWISGMGVDRDLDYRERFPANIGVIVRTEAAVDCADRNALLREMSRSPIIGTFRSSREAHVVAAQAQRHFGLEVTWVHADYKREWTFIAEVPPLMDANVEPRFPDPDAPIGKHDAGVHSLRVQLFILPPPLQQRGVGFTIIQPLHNATFVVNRHADQYTTMYTTFDAMRMGLARSYEVNPIVWWEDGLRLEHTSGSFTDELQHRLEGGSALFP